MDDRSKIIGQLVDSIGIPVSSYETARKRYDDLGAWVRRRDSLVASYRPHVYPQGSFRLGTVVRPVIADGEYDLDLGCRLRVGVTKTTHTQQQLKEMIGTELRAYRVARQIKAPLEELHRCWRLQYQDELPFHLDTVPSIPEDPYRRIEIRNLITSSGVGLDLAAAIVELTGAITDDRLPSYRAISNDWRVSNSEGYALWFESRMRLAVGLMEQRALQARVARVDDLPAYDWRSPLQACVQVLKRHRDVMFVKQCDSAPISIIITTLAGHAYSGETDLYAALTGVLRYMDSFIQSKSPRIPNPVNPAEDFADKWQDQKYRHLDLEGNFRRWLETARRDFALLASPMDTKLLQDHSKRAFAATLIGARFGAGELLAPAVGAGLSFPPRPVIPTKPAGFA
jgi:hypothetical protein